jgi:hypothetical protein
MKIRQLLMILLILLGSGVSGQSVNEPATSDLKSISIPVETVIDKIRGGLLGQILGNLNGLPHEMAYIQEPGNVKNYIPSLQNGAWTDDDTDFEWVYICTMQKKRNAFLPVDTISKLWKERINQRIWCANRYSRYLMDIGFKPPYTGYITFSPWAEFNISGQFLCETYGLLAPAMPQTAAKIGLNYTTVAIDNEPAQTTQLFTAMISTSFIESNINKIIDAGLKAIDPKSKTLQVCKDVRTWCDENPENWRETRRLLKEKYTSENGNIRDRNGYELNTGAIIASLLYGKGDFAETLKAAFNFGWDADCTAATCGTIVGVTKGYRWMMSQEWQIVDRYKNTTRENMPMDETISSFCDRLIDLFEMVNEQNGGKKELLDHVMVFRINPEVPMPVLRLSSVEEQKEILKIKLEESITKNILSGNRQEKAKAAYMAICLDMNTALSQKYPKQWKAACSDLAGYWKIMQNIFNDRSSGDFKGLIVLKNKFISAGFKAPARIYTDIELYGDTAVWKNPIE